MYRKELIDNLQLLSSLNTECGCSFIHLFLNSMPYQTCPDCLTHSDKIPRTNLSRYCRNAYIEIMV